MHLDTLTCTQEFRRVYKKGQLRFGKYVAVHCLFHQSSTRIGISVSRKVGNAVTRNRVRRRLREIVRSLDSNSITGCWLVIGTKARSRKAGFWDLRADLLTIMQEMGVLVVNRSDR